MIGLAIATGLTLLGPTDADAVGSADTRGIAVEVSGDCADDLRCQRAQAFGEWKRERKRIKAGVTAATVVLSIGASFAISAGLYEGVELARGCGGTSCGGSIAPIAIAYTGASLAGVGVAALVPLVIKLRRHDRLGRSKGHVLLEPAAMRLRF